MTNEEHAKMLLHRIGAMPYFDEQAIQKMIVDEFVIIKNEAAAELADRVNRLEQAEAAIVWALGYTDFGLNKPHTTNTYWWRKELRARSGITPEHIQELAAALKAGKA